MRDISLLVILILPSMLFAADKESSKLTPETIAAYKRIGARYPAVQAKSGIIGKEFPLFEFGGFATRELKAIHALPKPRVAFGLSFVDASDSTIDLLSDFDKLIELQLMMSPSVTDKGLKKIALLKNLQSLTLDDARISVSGSKALCDLQQLVDLDLRFRHLDEIATHFKSLPKLERLALHGSDLTDKGLAEISNVKSLKLLDIRQTSVTNEGLKSIQRIDGLMRLDVTDTRVTVDGLVALAPLKKLNDLRVLRWRGADGIVNDRSLSVLRKIHLLHALFLMAGKQASRPESANDVTSIDLEGTGVTDAGLRELQDFGNLRELNLFDLSVTDDGVKELARFKELTMVNLSCTGLSDAGLEVLKNLTRLKKIIVTDTKVTQAGVRELKKALPKCEIVWK
jgi:internalin A